MSRAVVFSLFTFLVIIILAETIYYFFFIPPAFSLSDFVSYKKEVTIGKDFIGLSKNRIKDLLEKPENAKKIIIPVLASPETVITSFTATPSGKPIIGIRVAGRPVLIQPSLYPLSLRTIASNKTDKVRMEYGISSLQLVFSIEKTSNTNSTVSLKKGEEASVSLETRLASDFADTATSYGVMNVLLYPAKETTSFLPQDIFLQYKNRYVIAISPV